MKAFDLTLAKAGAPVCTRNGRDVRIICWDKKGAYPIVGIKMINDDDWEEILCTTIEGYFMSDGKESPLDLFMKDPDPTLADYKSIKTYEDACKALGENPISIFEVKVWNDADESFDDLALKKYKHILALMKLETISRALRGDWKPKNEEYVFVPSFNDWDVVAYARGYHTDTTFSRFVQETEEKAAYFGNQFLDLWKEYLSTED